MMFAFCLSNMADWARNWGPHHTFTLQLHRTRLQSNSTNYFFLSTTPGFSRYVDLPTRSTTYIVSTLASTTPGHLLRQLDAFCWSISPSAMVNGRWPLIVTGCLPLKPSRRVPRDILLLACPKDYQHEQKMLNIGIKRQQTRESNAVATMEMQT